MTGQFKFFRAPFGLATSHKVITRLINIIFSDLIAYCIIAVFIGDILIPAESEKEAVKHQISEDY